MLRDPLSDGLGNGDKRKNRHNPENECRRASACAKPGHLRHQKRERQRNPQTANPANGDPVKKTANL